MRIRLVLAALTVATVMLAFPGTTLGATYGYRVINNYCYGDGGSSVYFKVRLIKPVGWYSATYFSVDGTAQHKELFGSRWSNEYWFDQQGQSVPNTYSRYTWWAAFWRAPDDTYRWHRIHLQLRVWSNNTVIASKTLNSVVC